MDPDPRNDAELVAETLSGDREAYGQLYDRFARVVRVVVASVSGDWTIADDMSQESFLRAYRKLGELRERERFGPWIVGIARRVGRERRRSLRRDRHEFREPARMDVQASSDGQAEVQRRDELQAVMRRVSELEERERLAIHAFFVEQRDAKHVAKLLGLSRSGMYALVHRALARLAMPSLPREIEQNKR